MRFNFNWKLSLFVVICFPIVMRLGFWQLDRAEQKDVVIAAQQALINEAEIETGQLKAEQWQQFRNALAKGEFSDKVFLVDNQIYKGKFGYEVIQPLKLENNSWLLVSRGWVAGNLDRRILPEIETPKGLQTLHGYLYQPGEMFALGEAAISSEWPKVIPSASVENMYKQLSNNDKMSPPFLLRLHDLHTDDGALFQAHWQFVNVLPEKHIGYAVQWFGMAALLIVLFLFASIKKRTTVTTSDTEA